MAKQRENEEAQQAAARSMTVNQKTAEEIITASIERMKQQNVELKNGKKDSPPQSPKGTLAPRDIDTVDTNNIPIDLDRLVLGDFTPPRRRSSTENSQPLRRRLSEPQTYTGTLGAGLDISPLRAGSASKAIPIRDPKMQSKTQPKTQVTPTKASKKISFTVDDTIDEESENEDA